MRRGPELHLFSSGALAAERFVVPVPFFLIRCRQGDVLVDGGNPLAVARDPRTHWAALADHFEAHMSEEDHCAAQVRRLGIAPESIPYIVQTHLHMDHTATRRMGRARAPLRVAPMRSRPNG